MWLKLSFKLTSSSYINNTDDFWQVNSEFPIFLVKKSIILISKSTQLQFFHIYGKLYMTGNRQRLHPRIT